MNSQETKLRKAESLRSFQRLILANSVDLYGCVFIDPRVRIPPHPP